LPSLRIRFATGGWHAGASWFFRRFAHVESLGSALRPPLPSTAPVPASYAARLGWLCGRAANVHDFVVRAISGHATTNMQEHYSSVSGDEVWKGLAKVLVLAGLAGGVDQQGSEGIRQAS
jgi:hypothetical protein